MYLALIGPAYLLVSGQWRRLANPWFLAANAGAAGLIALWAVPEALSHGDAFLTSQSALGPLLSRGLTDEPARPLEPFLSLSGSSGRGYRCRPSGWSCSPDAVPRRGGPSCFLLVPPGHGGPLRFAELLPALPASGRARPDHRGGLGAEPVLTRAGSRSSIDIPGSGSASSSSCSRFSRSRSTTGAPTRSASFDHSAPHDASDQIVLFKGNHWTVGQGLSFYADRRLARHFDDAGEVAASWTPPAPGSTGSRTPRTTRSCGAGSARAGRARAAGRLRHLPGAPGRGEPTVLPPRMQRK